MMELVMFDDNLKDCGYCENFGNCKDCKNCFFCNNCEKCEYCAMSTYCQDCQDCDYCDYCISCQHVRGSLLCTFFDYEAAAKIYDDENNNGYAYYYFKNMPTILSRLDKNGRWVMKIAHFLLENGEKVEAYNLERVHVHGFFYDKKTSKIHYDFLTFDDKKIVSFEPINFDDEI